MITGQKKRLAVLIIVHKLFRSTEKYQVTYTKSLLGTVYNCLYIRSTDSVNGISA